MDLNLLFDGKSFAEVVEMLAKLKKEFCAEFPTKDTCGFLEWFEGSAKFCASFDEDDVFEEVVYGWD